MLITELARATGFSTDTIRFYEKEGILNTPARRANGYRDYGAAAVACLRLCRLARDLGFSLEEIRELGKLVDNRQLGRRAVVTQLRRKQREIDARIASLRNLRDEIGRALQHPELFASRPARRPAASRKKRRALVVP